MKSEIWKKHWNGTAKSNRDIRFADGWGNRTIQEMIESINDIAKKLELEKTNVLLDVGCGAGLMELAYHIWIKQIYGVDYSEEMVKAAKINTKKIINVSIRKANILDLPFKDHTFDKVLVNSVIQYLDDYDKVENAIVELKRVAKKNAVIFLSLIPDLQKKDEFKNGYYKLNLTKEEIEHKIKTIEDVLWFEKKELKKIVEDTGLKVIGEFRPINHFQKKYYFDIVAIK